MGPDAVWQGVARCSLAGEASHGRALRRRHDNSRTNFSPVAQATGFSFARCEEKAALKCGGTAGTSDTTAREVYPSSGESVPWWVANRPQHTQYGYQIIRLRSNMVSTERCNDPWPQLGRTAGAVQRRPDTANLPPSEAAFLCRVSRGRRSTSRAPLKTNVSGAARPLYWS